MDADKKIFFVIFAISMGVTIAVAAALNVDMTMFDKTTPTVNLMLNNNLAKPQILVLPYAVSGKMSLGYNVTFIGFIRNPMEYAEVFNITWYMDFLTPLQIVHVNANIGVQSNQFIEANHTMPVFMEFWLSPDTPSDVESLVQISSVWVDIKVERVK